jgi:arsenite methyltransferase
MDYGGVLMDEKKIKELVKDRYTKIATKEYSNCSCCGGSANPLEEAQKQAKVMGYSEDEIRSIPEEAIYGLGCGNPTALAEISSGETVLDLGSGGGIDVFLASQKVGSDGMVIGVDMTSEMVKIAENNAREGGYKNVEFKLGEIENLPIEDESIDLIISNCVINLTPDKSVAYNEAFRVLKHGGRILVSDLVTEGHIPEEIRKNFQAWSECIAGAMKKQDYIDVISAAGFKDVEIVEAHYFTEPNMDERLVGKIVSLQIKAFK